MIKIVSVDQIRYLDKQTIASYGISGFHLMDLAGKGLANAILNRVNEYSSPPRILMFAGKGNNGGDVFSASKYLRKQKILHETIAFCKKSSIKGDNLLHFNKLNKSSIYPINFIDDPEKVKNYLSEFSPDIIVDGLIGTGIKSEVKGIVKKIIELINKTNNFVISVDIPSGMNGDTGEGFSVNADLTVTFGCPKIGMFSNTTGQEKCGKIINIDLCFPKALIDKVKTNAYLITSSDISTFIQKKPFTSHKGDFGRPLIFAGSPKYPGALILCAGASLLANAGVITVAALKELRDILLTYHPEVTYNIISGISPVSSYLRNLNKALDFTSLAFGPGLGKSKDTKDSLSIILKIFKDLPLIIDADGLNVLSKNIDLLKKRSSRQSKII
ncbi:MAG: NAD(P)H-hydrate epimerase, partial [Candidatus Aureabacteria bacterium]|nr:NAD(P)H-hydrate epimerase [Candidatus Auribacterota bacterium]